MAACAPLLSVRDPSAQVHYQAGRVLNAKEDYAGARREFELAMSKGYRTARLELARLLTDSTAKMLDPAQAVALYEQAWKDGVLIAGFELGKLYENGVSASTPALAVREDVSRAWLWYQKAAAAGEPDAIARLARRDEEASLTADTHETQDALLLNAFTLYARAAKHASEDEWPDAVWSRWRYRRSSLAKVLAGDDKMLAVADAYKRVLEEK
jgi:TPR repeat protein